MRTVIAYPGVEGSFSWSAAREIFPDGEALGCETFDDAAQAALDGRAAYALLPVENSFAGAVLQTYRLLEKLPLHIVGEWTKKVRHQLLGIPGASMEDIRRIESHPQAIAQCDEFLSGCHHVQIVPGVNTAICAKNVAMSGDKTRAAIASEEAASFYGLQVLKSDIQSSNSNTTRFFVVSRYAIPLQEPNKATVVFTVGNKVGALVKVLASFAESGLNMSRIESRPIPDTPFAYFFSADFEGSMDAVHVATAMQAAMPYTRELRLIGVYQRAVSTAEEETQHSQV